MPGTGTAAASDLRGEAAAADRLAWEQEIAEQRAAREYDRGFAAGLAARRVPRPRRAGPRPRWPRAVSG